MLDLHQVTFNAYLTDDLDADDRMTIRDENLPERVAYSPIDEEPANVSEYAYLYQVDSVDGSWWFDEADYSEPALNEYIADWQALYDFDVNGHSILVENAEDVCDEFSLDKDGFISGMYNYPYYVWSKSDYDFEDAVLDMWIEFNSIPRDVLDTFRRAWTFDADDALESMDFIEVCVPDGKLYIYSGSF